MKDVAVFAAHDVPRCRAFNGSTNCVTAMYRAHLPRLRTENTGKVNIELWDCPPAHTEFEELIDVIFVRRESDFAAYWGLDEDGRKRRILEVIQEAMMGVARRMGWPAEVFEQAYEAVLAKGPVHHFFLGKAFASPDRKRKARVWCEFDVDAIRVYLVVMDRRGKELKREFVTGLLPSDFFLYHAMGKVGWRDDKTVLIGPRADGRAYEIEV